MSLTSYRPVFATPGLARLMFAALLGRMPASMLGLTLILRITGADRSYALAGLLGAAGSGAVGIFGPMWSRLVDRTGQTRVLLGTAAGFAVCSAILGLIPAGSPAPLLIAMTVVTGAMAPPIVGCARALWPSVVHDRRVLESTYAVDSTAQEIMFITGPLLVVAVAGPFGTSAAMIVTGLVGLVGTVIFATAPGSRRWRGTPATKARSGSVLASPGVRTLVLVVFFVVVGFAATEVAIVAAAGGSHSTGLVGVLLAVWSGGSLLGGLAYGTRSWPGTHTRRVFVLLSASAMTTGALIVVSGTLPMGVLLLLNGLSCAPAFACVFVLVERHAPKGRATESFAWIASGAVGGGALGSALGGFCVTHGGATAGFATATGGALAAVAILALGRATLRTALPAAAVEVPQQVDTALEPVG
jgi:MFS family permease